MNKLKIPENHSGISKTLRLPENIVEDVQNLANLKNLSFNKTIISLLEFSLENLDDTYKKVQEYKTKQYLNICQRSCRHLEQSSYIQDHKEGRY